MDLGSNSWRPFVFSRSPGAWWSRPTSSGLGASGRLSEAAITRGLETLEVFSRFCGAYGLRGDDVHVVATSAIRDAINREDFLRAPRARPRPGGA